MANVFTPDEIVQLAQWQAGTLELHPVDMIPFQGHPFTCPNRGDGAHRDLFGDLGALVPTVRGWICPFCDYTQGWAHDFMKGGG